MRASDSNTIKHDDRTHCYHSREIRCLLVKPMGAAAERAGKAFDPATFKHEGHALCECHAEGYITTLHHMVQIKRSQCVIQNNTYIRNHK